ncbi:sigma-70 family RNA polymerase sigma factor [Frigidibacter sp. RF13]|uniref:sigma-70 family RNA polymerase sigma factor n=1 Tax=Frigidibacter sp. RF13 TaxID=2997340 RepID=UPI002270750F|nr:sigma-70 family RNA polymerase sigma factor [Frigidibacter sp. RF13]MCY1125570.1 sigma-70 family RNA polymerase sigma factor [Frigidibacter sp. RF13]
MSQRLDKRRTPGDAVSGTRREKDRVSEGDPIAELILRVAASDRAAFRALYQAASAKLFGVALRILQDRSEAEDAVQEVFTRIWLNARRFEPGRARGMTWLIAVARNHAIDRLRARPAPAEGDEAAERLRDPAPGPEAAAIARSEAGRIADCFGTLEPARADAIRGAYLNGLSYEDLAARHAVPLNTMRSWLRRGLLRLKECLEA